MIKLYFIFALGAMCAVFYFYGQNVGNSKCEMQHLNTQIEKSENNTKKQRILNEKVFKTGTDDVRRILRDKYTIKD